MPRKDKSMFEQVTSTRAGRRALEQERFLFAFQQKIRMIMKARKITNGQLAKKCGMPTSEVIYLLGGSANCSVRSLCDLCCGLDMSLEVALGGLANTHNVLNEVMARTLARGAKRRDDISVQALHE